MFDLRKTKKINLENAVSLKDDVAYQFFDESTGKKLIAKLIGYYKDDEDEYLIKEFRKLVLLSGEPEIGTAYFLATGLLKGNEKSCYVMDYIEGETLSSFLETSKEISYALAVDIVAQIAGGLEKAHHYEICHSDLHGGNIIIDNLGYVKLIDFLWWDYKMQASFNVSKDVEDFNKIATRIFEKCADAKNTLVRDLCLSSSNFKGLRKRIIDITNISTDWGMLADDTKLIISCLIKSLPNQAKYGTIYSGQSKLVPAKFIPPLDKNESKNNDAASSLFPMLDANRRLKIETGINRVFHNKLLPLKQAGLVSEWGLNVISLGNTFLGPYIMNYFISFSSKFFEWKKIVNEFDFLPPIDNTDVLGLVVA